MKLSIITINFNNREGLIKTADSVLSQSFRDFEWILIDGGSSDGSAVVIADLANNTEANVSFWCSEPDNGIYNAMNKGIRKANGEYVLFLNSGDFLVDCDVLGKVFLYSFNEDVVFGDQLWDYGDELYTLNSPDEVTLKTFIFSNIQHSGVSLIKRALFDTYGYYDESLKIVSDWKWFLHAIGLGHASAKHIDIVMSVFDMGGISVRNKDLSDKEKEMIIQQTLPPKLLIDYKRYDWLEHEYKDMEIRIRKSKSYRIGHAILAPIKAIREFVNNLSLKIW